MRIGSYYSGIDISFSEAEMKIIGSNRCNVEFDIEGKLEPKKWLMIVGKSNGLYKIGRRSTDNVPSIRARPPNAKNLPFFGIEQIEAFSPTAGTLYGFKPKMNIPLIKRGPITKKPAAPKAVSEKFAFEHIGQAVKLINNFKLSRAEGEVEVALTKEGLLLVRLHIDFGA